MTLGTRLTTLPSLGRTLYRLAGKGLLAQKVLLQVDQPVAVDDLLGAKYLVSQGAQRLIPKVETGPLMVEVPLQLPEKFLRLHIQVAALLAVLL